MTHRVVLLPFPLRCSPVTLFLGKHGILAGRSKRVRTWGGVGVVVELRRLK